MNLEQPISSGPSKETGAEQPRAALERAGRVLQRVEALPKGKVPARVSGRMQVLAFVVGIGMSAGVYKGMEGVASAIVDRIHLVTDAFSHLKGRSAEAAPLPVQVAQNEVRPRTVESPEQVAAVAPAVEEVPATHVETDEERDERIVDNDGTAGQTIAEVLVDVIWDDHAFKALRTPEEIERFITGRIEDMCPADARGCDQEMLRSHLVGGLRAKARTAMEASTTPPDQLARIARGIRMTTRESDHIADSREFSELDVALHARDPRLVEDFLHSDLNHESGPVSGHLGDYVSSRMEGIQGVYGSLSPVAQEEFARSIHQTIDRLTDITTRLSQSGGSQAARQAQYQQQLEALRNGARALGI